VNNQFKNRKRVSTEFKLLILLIAMCDTCVMYVYKYVCGTSVYMCTFIYI